MTRDNLIQAIYDSGEWWSCTHDCDVSAKEDFKYECKRCAKKLLEEYENGIRTKVIEEFVKSLFANDVIDKSVVRRVAERLKEQK